LWLNFSSAPASAVSDRRKRDRSVGRVATATVAAADLDTLTSCLRAGDFRERCRGLEMLRDLAVNKPQAVSNNVTVVSYLSLSLLLLHSERERERERAVTLIFHHKPPSFIISSCAVVA